MVEKLLIGISLVLAISCLTVATRSGKAISVFNIVKFANEQCNGTDSKFGTCYTEDECEDRGGKSSGSCADGYGVCCTFTMGCGDVKSENCTYFESSGTPVGACNVGVCRTNKNICQIRLDFDTFEIAGPSASTVTIGKLLNGVVSLDAGKEMTTMGRCDTDSFVVNVPGGLSSPVICGKNTGQHLYIEATDTCSDLSFQLGASSSTTRSWAIKIVQYSCDYNNLAPQGCLQYHFAGTTGTIESFNYAGTLHLANQDQNICVRRERNYCRICWSNADGEFDISSMEAVDMGQNLGLGSCCGFGADGMKTIGYDCVIIPDATKQATVGVLAAGGSEFCGRALATGAAVGARKTVCSQRTPFSIRFLSDNFEFMDEAAKNPDGFKLTYTQTKCA